MNILIYGTKYKEENLPYLNAFFRALEENDITAYIYEPYAKDINSYEVDHPSYPSISTHEDLAKANIDYVITLGGDGTILSAITLIKDLNIPIMGINLGRLGFLSNVEKSRIKKSIKDLVDGNYIRQSRSLIKLESNIPAFKDFPYALNDFTLHKRDTSSMVTIHTYVDDQFLNSYWADGLIIATPTGSTGYNLSCGGPIIFPNSGNFVITPVAPHNLNVRPVVLSDASKIALQIEGRSENFLCTLDSRYETVTSEHELLISCSPFRVNFAIPQGVNFMNTIREKLMWGLDKRN